MKGPISGFPGGLSAEPLFLRIHGNDGLASRLSRKDFGVDGFELGIAIGVARALVGFPVDLA